MFFFLLFLEKEGEGVQDMMKQFFATAQAPTIAIEAESDDSDEAEASPSKDQKGPFNLSGSQLQAMKKRYTIYAPLPPISDSSSSYIASPGSIASSSQKSIDYWTSEPAFWSVYI